MLNATDPLHIVFISDENYVMPTVVAISSIYHNRNINLQYCIHVICCEVAEKNKELFRNLNNDNFEVKVVEVRQSDDLAECKIKNLHVSTAALYKFNIANLFPDIDKLLYLDGDILVQDNLETIFKIDISNVYAAVVKDYKPMTYNPPQVEKLGVNHSAYFNSGVMLLNLKKFREDDLFHKLLNYRLHGINFFMDQDALNVVFGEKVVYLPLYYNVMSSVMGYFTLDDLTSYYELSNIESKKDIYSRAIIVHLCTKYKPWTYSNVPFAEEWYHYYQLSPISKPLCREILEEVSFQTFKEFDLETAKTEKESIVQDVNVIVSLTSFPARVNSVHFTIQSLLKQTYLPKQIVLWLAKEQFPNAEKELPEELLKLQDSGVFIIKWCDDLKPHKKYYYAMQEYADMPIITVDDDVIYSENTVQQLVESYKKFPFAVSALRTHRIKVTEEKQIAPYRFWKREIKDVGIPSLALCATGVGGVLYPPHILPSETFNKYRIQEVCLNADDLWLKTMELINYVPVVLAGIPTKLEFVPHSQEVALWKENDTNGRNDTQLETLLEMYNHWHGANDTLLDRLSMSVNMYQNVVLFYRNLRDNHMKRQLRLYRNEIHSIHASWSYRIGRFITFIPRKIRGGLQCYQEHGLSYTLDRLLVHLHLKDDLYKKR